MLGPLVIGGEARGVRRLGDLALEDLLEGVDALARGSVDVAHQMHLSFGFLGRRFRAYVGKVAFLYV